MQKVLLRNFFGSPLDLNNFRPFFYHENYWSTSWKVCKLSFHRKICGIFLFQGSLLQYSKIKGPLYES